MNGSYDPKLVTLSVLVAIIASYTALDLASCVSSTTSSPRKSWTWLIAGAVSMGIGISAMHYIGMYAMKMSPPIHYDPVLFVASVLIATGASLAALWTGFQLRRKRTKLANLAKLGSACAIGFAISGIHYTGMAAAHFASGSISIAAIRGGIDNTMLAVIIGGSTVAILSLTLIVSALDAHFAMNNAKLAEALRKVTLDLHDAQVELVTAARQAGMAQIANNVLHNVGNVLNSVNVSADLVCSKTRDSKVQGLTKAVELMNAHAADLGDFLTRDEKGRTLPGYLNKLVVTLGNERQSIIEELASLTKNIDHIKEIVTTQQSYAGATTLIESVQIQDLLEDALRMNAASAARHQITIVKDFAEVPMLKLDKHLVLQILVNLIGNAKQAMEGVPGQSHQITLRTRVTENDDQPRLQVRVEDDGEGIAPENLAQLFGHGFTTRRNGHGFGLHSCALAAKEMGGEITAQSDGRGRGAAFMLEIPMSLALRHL